jgi:hypothetical protein
MSGETLDSCGICGTRETPQELATRRLMDRPTESEWFAANGIAETKYYQARHLDNFKFKRD